MESFLFSYPHCLKCEEVKNFLREKAVAVQEFSLIQKESRLKIREFLGHIKRDEKGSIIIPALVFQENSRVVAVLNNRQELEEWWKSKA